MIPGFNLHENFITPLEEQDLLQAIDKERWSHKLSRRTQHYGYIYDYKRGSSYAKTTPIPHWCDFLIDRLVDKNVLARRPNQMIINEYMPGQGIAPHIDDPSSFDDGIVSVSLGSPIYMDFIGDKKRKEVYLPRRSMFSLHKQARYLWKHGIAARKYDHKIMRKRRVSLTFRIMKRC